MATRRGHEVPDEGNPVDRAIKQTGAGKGPVREMDDLVDAWEEPGVDYVPKPGDKGYKARDQWLRRRRAPLYDHERSA